MNIITCDFLKLQDDETCALLKPDLTNKPAEQDVVNHVMEIFKTFPGVKARIKLKLESE